MNQPIIGCVQLNSQLDVEHNLASIAAAIKHAKAEGVHLLVLPENACRMGGQRKLSARFDELSSWYGQLAAQYQMFVVAGTLPCPYRPCGTPVPDGKVRQVSQVFAPDGRRIARYDKIHLFKAEVADSTGSYDEGRTFEAGSQTAIAQCDMASLLGHPLPYVASNGAQRSAGQATDTHLLSIGLMVCFDLRFPALAQRLRQAGADVLSAPSAFTYKTGEAHWQLLLKARALDAQCLVVGSAQGGSCPDQHGGSRETWGHSTITNANGDVVVTSGQTVVAEDFALITAPFDRQQQQTWRQNMPIDYCHRLS